MAEPLSLNVTLKMVDRMTAPARAAMGANRKLANDLEHTRGRLIELDQVQRDLTRRAKLEEKFSRVSRNLHEATERVTRYETELASTDKPSKTLIRNLESARRSQQKFTNQLDELNPKLDASRTKMKDAGLSTEDLADAQRTLQQRIDATNGALEQQTGDMGRAIRKQQELYNLRNKYQQASQIASNLTVSGTGAVMTGQSIVNPIFSAIKEAGQKQSAVADIAITADLSDSEIEKVKKSISQAAEGAFRSGNDVTLGLNTLLTDGMEFNQAIGILSSVAKTATASNSAIQNISKTSFSLNKNMGISEKEMPKALDMLVVGGKAGAFELENMSQYFPMLTAEAQKLGLTGVKAVATLGASLQIAKRGAGDASEAANNMKNFLAKMTAPDTIKNFKKMHVDLEAEIKTAVKNGSDPVEHMLQLIEKLTGGDAFKIGKLFGDMQVKSFITPLLKDWEDYKAIKRQMLAADGAVQADLDRRVELDPTLQWQQFEDSLKTLRSNAVLPLIGPLNELMQSAMKYVKIAGEWAAKNPELVKTIMITVVGVGALVMAGGALTFALGSILGPLAMVRYGIGLFGAGGASSIGMLGRLTGGIGITRAAFLAFSRVLMFTPLGWIITLATGAYLVYKNWDKLKNWWNSWTLKDVGVGVGKHLRKFVNWWQGMSLREKMATVSFPGLKLGYDLAKQAAAWWLGWTPKEVEAKLKSGMISTAIRLVKEFRDLWNNLTLKKVTATIVRAGAAPFVQAAKTGRSTWNSVSQFAQGVYQGFSGTTNEKKPLFGGGRATGGPVSAGTLYEVNELGPELLMTAGRTFLMSSQAGHVTPLQQMSAANQPPGSIRELMSSSLIQQFPDTLREFVKEQAANDQLLQSALPEHAGENVIPLTARNNQNVTHSQHISITVNAAPGMDERQVAEMVVKEFRAQQFRNTRDRHGYLFDGNEI